MNGRLIAQKLIQPGKNVQLEILNENGQKIIYRTSVWNSEGDQMEVFIPENDKILKNMQPGAGVTIICRSDNNACDYVFATQFIGVEKEPPVIILNLPEDLKAEVGRHFFRCEVNFPFQFFGKKGKFIGTVVNLSINGLFAVIDPQLNLDTGTSMTCQMILPGNSSSSLFVAKIMRTIKDENFQGIGLNFQQIDKNIQDQITKFLFQRQRAMMNHGQICIVKNSG